MPLLATYCPVWVGEAMPLADGIVQRSAGRRVGTHPHSWGPAQNQNRKNKLLRLIPSTDLQCAEMCPNRRHSCRIVDVRRSFERDCTPRWCVSPFQGFSARRMAVRLYVPIILPYSYCQLSISCCFQ
jgi:hypothetical protein